MEKKKRYIEQMNIPAYDAGILTSAKELSALFEHTAELCGDPKEASNWIMGELLKLLNDSGQTPEDMSIREDSLGEIILLVKSGRISRASGKTILKAAWEEGVIPEEYASQHDLWQISDEVVLEEKVKEVILQNPKAVKEYHDGKTKNFQFLLGQSMRATKGKADPKVLQNVLTRLLQS